MAPPFNFSSMKIQGLLIYQKVNRHAFPCLDVVQEIDGSKSMNSDSNSGASDAHAMQEVVTCARLFSFSLLATDHFWRGQAS